MYQITVGWTTYTPEYQVTITMKPTPRKKKAKNMWHLGHFFPQQIFFFRGLGLVSYRKETKKKPNPTKFSRKTPNFRRNLVESGTTAESLWVLGVVCRCLDNRRPKLNSARQKKKKKHKKTTKTKTTHHHHHDNIDNNTLRSSCSNTTTTNDSLKRLFYW